MQAEAGDTGGLASELVAHNFTASGGQLQIGGLGVEELAEAYGTPLFIYDAALLRRSYRQISAAVDGFAEVYYSIKANPNPSVARVLVGEGAGLEIASAAEFERARTAGCGPERIIYAGPGKTVADLEHVVAGGIGEIHVESINEIERLASVTRRLGQRIGVSIRVNPVAAAQGGSMVMGGRPSPFGIDEERLLEAADAIGAHAELHLRGVHIFAGTQVLQADVLGRQWSHGLDIADRLSEYIGRPLTTIDLGGGLGIPYFEGDRALDLEKLTAIAKDLAKRRHPDTHIILEPGRFLAGPAGIYVTRVIDIKVSRGERFVVVDGGMNHHLAASGNLGQVIKRDYPVVAATRMGETPDGPAAVVGPLCTPLDVLARRAPLPNLAPGDLVAVLQSGAYGLTASPVGFLSQPTPAEVLVDAGQHTAIRPRGTFQQPLAPLP